MIKARTWNDQDYGAQDETTPRVNTSTGLSLPRREGRLSSQAGSWATAYCAAMGGFQHKGRF